MQSASTHAEIDSPTPDRGQGEGKGDSEFDYGQYFSVDFTALMAINLQRALPRNPEVTASIVTKYRSKPNNLTMKNGMIIKM